MRKLLIILLVCWAGLAHAQLTYFPQPTPTDFPRGLRKNGKDVIDSLYVIGQLALKQNLITTGSTSQYFRGDLSLATLNTSVVPESGNLYYTNARGIGSLLTGYTSGAGTVSASDNILQAIQKLNGNIGALVTGVSSVNTSDASLSFSPTVGAVLGGINYGHTGTYTVQQNFATNTVNAITIGDGTNTLAGMSFQGRGVLKYDGTTFMLNGLGKAVTISSNANGTSVNFSIATDGRTVINGTTSNGTDWLQVVGTASLGVTGVNEGGLKMAGFTSGVVSILPSTTGATYSLRTPATAPAANQFLVQNSGNTALTWLTTISKSSLDTSASTGVTTRSNLTPLVATYGDGRWLKLNSGSAQTISGAGPLIINNSGLFIAPGIAFAFQNAAGTANNTLASTGAGNVTTTIPWGGTLATTTSALLTPANYYSTSGTPTGTLGTSSIVGTGATFSIAGNNQSGIITLNTGTSISAGGTVLTVTMSGGFAYPTTCGAVLQPKNASAAGFVMLTDGNTTQFQVNTGSGNLNASTTYIWQYHNLSN